jgi:uncharacterized protein YcgI (DUF1989 family)
MTPGIVQATGFSLPESPGILDQRPPFVSLSAYKRDSMVSLQVGERLTIPARHGKAIQVEGGQRMKVINTFGQQVLDTWAFSRSDPAEYMSMEHSRSRLSKVNPNAGDTLVTNLRRPILSLVEDTSPGIHDTLLCPCNAALYRELGCTTYHRNCEDNLHEALSELGCDVAWTPAALNLFMNTPFNAQGLIDREPPASRAGDHVVLRSEMDLVLVFSACPQDLSVINGVARQPTDAHVEGLA